MQQGSGWVVREFSKVFFPDNGTIDVSKPHSQHQFSFCHLIFSHFPCLVICGKLFMLPTFVRRRGKVGPLSFWQGFHSLGLKTRDNGNWLSDAFGAVAAIYVS